MSDEPVEPHAVDRIATGDTIAANAFTLQAGVVVVAGLYLAREVLIPITLAVLLTFILAPVVALLQRLRLGRVPAVLLAVLVAVGVISGVATVIGSQVASLATDIPKYAQTVETKFETVRSYTLGRLSQMAASVGRQGAAETPAPAKPGSAPAPAQAAAPAAGAEGNSPMQLAQRYLSPVLSPLATVGIVFVVAIFMLLQREDLRDRLIRLFGADDLHRTTGALDDAGRRLSRYFLTQLLINSAFGAVIGVGLFFVGVPNPVLWGLLSALMRFVPYIGSFISGGLPLALAAAVDPGWGMAIWTAVIYVVVELLVSQVVEPLMYGRSTGLSPFAVVVSAIFWSWLWGPIGLILSMPLTLCLVVLGRYAERLEFLEVLLGDRPALTPVESFYQRVLAGDADEAQSHAEEVLKTCPLGTYYDEVAVRGLQLAAADSERGVLKPVQLGRIRRTITSLVAELDRHGDATPEVVVAPDAWRAEGSVLCLAGRGDLDDAASKMLAQMLGHEGFGARIVAHAAASREQIGVLDVAGVRAVCVTFLGITGSPSHLRYLMQRLRRVMPGVPVVVGIWPGGDVALTDERVRAVIGAEHYATSLRDAVGFVVSAAASPGTARAGETQAVPGGAQPPQASRLTGENASLAGITRTGL